MQSAATVVQSSGARNWWAGIIARRQAPKFASRRLRRECRTIQAMIAIYCRDQHGGGGGLCPGCSELLEYATVRLERCPFGEEKPTCVNCPVHCYQPERREQVRAVMRHAGPRMLLRHPLLAIFHLIDGRRPAPPVPKKRARGAGGSAAGHAPGDPGGDP